MKKSKSGLSMKDIESIGWEAFTGSKAFEKQVAPKPTRKEKKFKGFGVGEPITLTHPNVIESWDYKHSDFAPQHYSYGSKQKEWFICEQCNFSFYRAINHYFIEQNGKICPQCSKANTYNKNYETINRETGNVAIKIASINGQMGLFDSLSYTSNDSSIIKLDKKEDSVFETESYKKEKRKFVTIEDNKKHKELKDKYTQHCEYIDGNARSVGEKQVYTMIAQKYNLDNKSLKFSHRLGIYELDIFNEEEKWAIEYNCNLYHTENKLDNKKIENFEKKEKCIENEGIFLITVWEEDFLKDKNKVMEDVYFQIKHRKLLSGYEFIKNR